VAFPEKNESLQKRVELLTSSLYKNHVVPYLKNTFKRNAKSKKEP
jgi:hypothetical protein